MASAIQSLVKQSFTRRAERRKQKPKQTEKSVCSSFVLFLTVSRIFPVAMRLWETPVPIPNTTVKTQAADDTWLETARESKWLPDSFKRTAAPMYDIGV